MPKPQYSFSIPTKFELETLKTLRESALANQRSLSGEVRFRVLQTLDPKDIKEGKDEQNCN